jgi:hypothetical protein
MPKISLKKKAKPAPSDMSTGKAAAGQTADGIDSVDQGASASALGRIGRISAAGVRHGFDRQTGAPGPATGVPMGFMPAPWEFIHMAKVRG